MEAILVYAALVVLVAIIAVRHDRKAKMLEEGFNPNALDRDGDGIVQEGTKFERKAKPKAKPKPKAKTVAKPKKKAPAKSKTTGKAKPKKK